ncbi:MAG: HNH endonuclease signature motif containing protein [Acidobacteria bacterium]|nr:HNH endonuclease signature motif containing protein [Acidobacteriota bacterium]
MDEQTKVLVWQKGTVIPGYDPTQWRRDEDGNALSFAAYGDRSSDYGWEIDHIHPVAEGGGDSIANLRPLHWRVNSGRQ